MCYHPHPMYLVWHRVIGAETNAVLEAGRDGSGSCRVTCILVMYFFSIALAKFEAFTPACGTQLPSGGSENFYIRELLGPSSIAAFDGH